MLKTFNVVEKYEPILPFLDSKKNQSSYICELILKDMKGEQLVANMEELKQDVSDEIAQGILNLKNVIQAEIKRGIREEIREEIRSEIRSEVRGEMRDLRRFLTEQFAEVTLMPSQLQTEASIQAFVHSEGRGGAVTGVKAKPAPEALPGLNEVALGF